MSSCCASAKKRHRCIKISTTETKCKNDFKNEETSKALFMSGGGGEPHCEMSSAMLSTVVRGLFSAPFLD